MTLGQRRLDTDDARPAPQIGLVLPFGGRRPEATSPDGRWETVARIPAVRPTRPSDEPTLELPVVRIDGAAGADGPALVSVVDGDPRTVSLVDASAHVPATHPELLQLRAGDVAGANERGGAGGGAGGGDGGGAWWLAAGRSAGRPGGPRSGEPRSGDRARVLFATLIETLLELAVALMRLLIDGVTSLYRILQRFGTAAVVVAMVLVGLRMIPWAELAAFLHALSSPP